jgi:GT2 family glycosyltransferase
LAAPCSFGELLIADQSRDAGTWDHLRCLAAREPRLRLLHLEQRGKSRALNRAVAAASGEILAFIDDDCTVEGDWLAPAVAAFAEEPAAGIVFGAVEAVPHDPQNEYIPVFALRRRGRVHGRFGRPHLNGIGANMVVRRAVLEQVGGFDERMGPGGQFRSGDDWELAYRVLRAGYAIVQEPSSVVLHWGRRSRLTPEARRAITNNFYGFGAGFASHLARGDVVAGFWLLREVVHRSTVPLVRLAGGRRPLCARHPLYLLRGAYAGLRWATSAREPGSRHRAAHA